MKHETGREMTSLEIEHEMASRAAYDKMEEREAVRKEQAFLDACAKTDEQYWDSVIEW
jgi:hypothetical protein